MVAFSVAKSLWFGRKMAQKWLWDPKPKRITQILNKSISGLDFESQTPIEILVWEFRNFFGISVRVSGLVISVQRFPMMPWTDRGGE